MNFNGHFMLLRCGEKLPAVAILRGFFHLQFHHHYWVGYIDPWDILKQSIRKLHANQPLLSVSNRLNDTSRELDMLLIFTYCSLWFHYKTLITFTYAGLTSKLRRYCWTINGLSCRYGTQLVRNVSEQLQAVWLGNRLKNTVGMLQRL